MVSNLLRGCTHHLPGYLSFFFFQEKLLDHPSSLIKCWVNELLRDKMEIGQINNVDVNALAGDVMAEGTRVVV
jgi:hypothetical protein